MKKLYLTLTVLAVLAFTGGAFAFAHGGWGGGHMGGGMMGPGMMGGYEKAHDMMGSYGMYDWDNNNTTYGNPQGDYGNKGINKQNPFNRNQGNQNRNHGNFGGNTMPFWR